MFINVEYLTDVLKDKNRSAEEHERAATALAFYAERIKYPVDHPECGFNSNVARMLASMEIQTLWFSPDDALFQTHTGNDGSTYRSVASQKYHGRPQASEPTPIPAAVKQISSLPEKTEEPIAPPEENKYLPFDARYHPSEVARRVAAIEREAAEFRRQREEEDERRGFSL